MCLLGKCEADDADDVAGSGVVGAVPGESSFSSGADRSITDVIGSVAWLFKLLLGKLLRS